MPEVQIQKDASKKEALAKRHPTMALARKISSPTVKQLTVEDMTGLHPDILSNLPKTTTDKLAKIVDQQFNVLHLPERPLQRQTTVRSCATGRHGKVTDLSMRVKTEGNVSNYNKESISDNMLNEWASSRLKNESLDDQSFSHSSMKVKTRMHQQAIQEKA